MMKRHNLLLLLALVAGAGSASTPAKPDSALKLERAVLLMRHGVRPPTKSPPMPTGIAADPWPSWSVKPGYLTENGARAIEALARSDRADWVQAGLLPASGCGAKGLVRLIADTDQRTIATADHYGAGLLPGCPVANEHRPEGAEDPIFSPIDLGVTPVDAAAADRAVRTAIGGGGLAAVETRMRPLLTQLDTILCGKPPPTCGLSRLPSGFSTSANARPKLSGALDRGSTAAHILLLEYADGKPASEIGWGRATAADIERLGALHATEFALLARPRYLAARNLSGIAPLMLGALFDPRADAPRVTMLSGHDTNVANLGGLLDLHWRLPGFATDDPTPGGAIVLELLRDASGAHYVRARYRSQTLDQIRRGGAGAAVSVTLPLPGCSARGVVGLCTRAAFEALMKARLAS